MTGSSLNERVALLRKELPASIHLHYAIKANPMPAVVQHLRPLVDGFDVASGKELAVALDTGMNPSNIAFAGPGKTDAELGQAMAAGILIEIESARRIAAYRQYRRRKWLCTTPRSSNQSFI